MTACAQTDNAKNARTSLLIGIGNEFRTDDGIGVVVARAVRQKARDLQVVEASGEGAALMEQWSAAQNVVIVDAVRSGSAPGRIHRLDVHKQRIPTEFFNYSTHAFSLAEAVEVSRALETLPERMVIFGVEGSDFSAGQVLSSPVNAVVNDVVRLVLKELGKNSCSGALADHAESKGVTCTNSH